jgi:hypothetical protein
MVRDEQHSGTGPAADLRQVVQEAEPAVRRNQALGVWVGQGDPGIFHAPGEVEVSAQRMSAQVGSGEPAPGALERDRTLGDGVGERASITPSGLSVAQSQAPVPVSFADASTGATQVKGRQAGREKPFRDHDADGPHCATVMRQTPRRTMSVTGPGIARM